MTSEDTVWARHPGDTLRHDWLQSY